MESSRNEMAHNISAAKCEMKPDMKLILSLGGIFVLSGVLQPILMAIAENAGIADSTCMIYMLPYYFGPFLLSFTLCFPSKNPNNATTASPSFRTCFKAVIIAFFDLTAQSMNYSGAAMAGPTLFAIIYSSVTVWTAVLSLIILKRQMICIQWLGVVTVFGGLVITGLDSVALGPKVFHGSCLVLFGSAMHALTYVLSESIMTSNKDGPALSVVMNCSIQMGVGMTINLIWQLTYTRKHFNELILVPMQERSTTPLMAFYILGAIALVSFIHASTFFYTLKHFPGGSTSAGIGKGKLYTSTSQNG